MIYMCLKLSLFIPLFFLIINATETNHSIAKRNVTSANLMTTVIFATSAYYSNNYAWEITMMKLKLVFSFGDLVILTAINIALLVASIMPSNPSYISKHNAIKAYNSILVIIFSSIIFTGLCSAIAKTTAFTIISIASLYLTGMCSNDKNNFNKKNFIKIVITNKLIPLCSFILMYLYLLKGEGGKYIPLADLGVPNLILITLSILFMLSLVNLFPFAIGPKLIDNSQIVAIFAFQIINIIVIPFFWNQHAYYLNSSEYFILIFLPLCYLIIGYHSYAIYLHRNIQFFLYNISSINMAILSIISTQGSLKVILTTNLV